MKHFTLKLLSALLMALLLSNCGLAGAGMGSGASSGPAYVETSTTVCTNSAEFAYVEGNGTDQPLLCVRKNFFDGDKGDYRLHGNYGLGGVSWEGYGDCVINAGAYLAHDLICHLRGTNYYPGGRFVAGQFYCLNQSSGTRTHNGRLVRNWNDHTGNQLRANQVYLSPEGHRNISLAVHPGFRRFEVSDEMIINGRTVRANPVRKPC